MKKLILSLMAVFVMAIPASAAWDAASRVTTVGTALLTKSGLPTANVKFVVVSDVVDNSNYATNKTINISKAELAYAGNDNEVAAVVANELSHIICGHASKAKFVSMLQEKSKENATLNTDNSTGTTPTVVETAANAATKTENLKIEKEADIIAVNMMVSANYNPLALVVVLTKMPAASSWDMFYGRPANSERAMNVYDYTSYVAPDKVKAGYACNEYRTFLTYANPIVEKRKANKKSVTKFNKNMAKLKKASAEKLSKYKIRGGMSGWDAATEFLKN